jgi:Vitamin K-dependent gamma-carboxylase
MSFSRLFNPWNVFFFARTSLLPVSLFRIGIGLFLIQFDLLLLPDLNSWYGAKGVLSQHCIASHFFFPTFSLLDLLPESLQSISSIFILLLVSSISMTIGYRTRISACIAFMCLVTIYHANPFNLNSGDTYMRQQVFWLIFSQAGDELSIDSWKKHRGNIKWCPLGSLWPIRMMQLQFCLVYADSLLSKMQNSEWISGYAVYYTSRLVEFHKFPLPIFDHLLVCQLLSWSTLILEYALCTLIWIKPFRYPLLVLALIFHVIIDWHMNIPQFEWLMILSLLLFIDAKDLLFVVKTVERFLYKKRKLI